MANWAPTNLTLRGDVAALMAFRRDEGRHLRLLNVWGNPTRKDSIVEGDDVETGLMGDPNLSSVEYRGEARWAPNLEVLEPMSQEHPTLSFDLRSMDPAMCWEMRVVVFNGRTVFRYDLDTMLLLPPCTSHREAKVDPLEEALARMAEKTGVT